MFFESVFGIGGECVTRTYCVSAIRVVHLLVVDEGPVRVKYACTVAILYICELASPLLRER